jgi:hypothetical protein
MLVFVDKLQAAHTVSAYQVRHLERIFNTCPTLISTFTRDKTTKGFEVDKHLGHDKKDKIKTLEVNFF